jgi:hypothetical protein
MDKININVTSNFWPHGFESFMVKVILVLVAVSLFIHITDSLRGR